MPTVLAESVYVYGLARNTTLPPVVQLTAIRNTRNRVTVDGRYLLTGAETVTRGPSMARLAW
jgi:hypothetical protein